MVCFAVTLEVDQQHWDKARRIIAELTAASRNEPGNLAYFGNQSQADPHKFLIYERYKDQAAVEAHRASEHFQRLAANGLYKLIANRSMENFDPLE